MNYTKGPWQIEKTYGSIPEIRTKERRIAKPLYHMGSEDREVEANAHLIAACPDMYEALEDLVKLLQCDDPVEVGCSCTDTGTGAPLICPWCIAKKALAKAEGRE